MALVAHTSRAHFLEDGEMARVTEGGVAAAGVRLMLRFFNGTQFVTAQETLTAADGSYRFANIPGLTDGQAYYVLYRNTSQNPNPNRLGGWASFQLLSYAVGTRVDGGSFDIKNIALQAPEPGADVALPATFRWTRRGIAGDNYVWQLLRLPSFEMLAQTPGLGDVSSYTLPSLPPGVETGLTYGWSLLVYNQPRDEFNYGQALYYRDVGFTGLTFNLYRGLFRQTGERVRPAGAEFGR